MAEYVKSIAEEDTLDNLTARTNGIFGEVMAKLEILLQFSSHGATNSFKELHASESLSVVMLTQDEFLPSVEQIKIPSPCSHSSFRGAMNSCQETLRQPFRSNHISPVAESSREFNQRMAELSREIKQSSTRIIDLLQEEIDATESTNGSLWTSAQTISPTEPIDEQSTVVEEGISDFHQHSSSLEVADFEIADSIEDSPVIASEKKDLITTISKDRDVRLDFDFIFFAPNLVRSSSFTLMTVAPVCVVPLVKATVNTTSTITTTLGSFVRSWRIF
ncbi:unnamed protein product [Trifolium pratense]|uniref:Uncharacterized protein n=1 Tax=Trifolium pratense TaxID=57577 RepID=A0ACB0K6E0_TRIPR|nr:unnamed protein product [Trifolium pratense]